MENNKNSNANIKEEKKNNRAHIIAAIIAILLIIAVIVILVINAGDKDVDNSSNTESSVTTTTTTTTTEEPADVTTTTTTTKPEESTTTVTPTEDETSSTTTTTTKKPETTTTTTTKNPETTTTTTTKKPETTTTTTKKPVDVPSKEVTLNVEPIVGYTELKSGSGITAAAIVLKYYGIDVELLKLKQYADIYGLNTIEDGVTPSPWDVIVGEPLTATAKYYAKPIIDMVNNYANKNGLNNIKAKDISGATLDELMSYINKGKPVIVWGTKTGEPAEDGISWILPNGEKFTAKAKVTVYVVVGYTESEILIMNDVEIIYPLPKDDFVSMYESVYSQAILIE